MNPREKKVIEKQKKEDGGWGKSNICPKHKIRLEIISIGKTHAQLGCRKCQDESKV